jgi:hypothetical protein
MAGTTDMTRLALTTDSSGAGSIKASGFADIAIALERRLVWGRPPSNAETEAFFAARTTRRKGLHWQDYSPSWRIERSGGKDFGLIEFCARCDSVELWIDPDPNAQLTLLWLLDFLRGHEHLASKVKLVQADCLIAGRGPEELAKWQPRRVNIAEDHLEIASAACHAYRAPTPQAWFSLLGMDLSALPQLGRTVVELLEELPGRATGLGATEMRMLELVSEGNLTPPDVFPGHEKRNTRRVYGYWEIGELLDGLAHCPVPAVTGLDEGPFTLEMHKDHSRHRRYTQSRLSLTVLGKAVLAGADDFSRHNPIHRWLGGTQLANNRLWCWDPASSALIAP